MKRRAFALAVVLWAVGILAFALVTTAAFIDASLSSEALSAQAAKARQLALSGIAFATTAKTDSFPCAFTRNVAEQGTFKVTRSSESGRINLNALLRKKDREALNRVLAALGGDQQKAVLATNELFHRTWLAGDKATTGFLPFESFAQIQNISEFGEAVGGANWRDKFTLWGEGLIDLNYTDSETLALIGGINAEQVALFLKARVGADGVPGTRDDAKFESVEQVAGLLGLDDAQAERLNRYFGVKTDMHRVEATATVGRLKRHVLVILKLEDTNAQPVVWDEV